MFTHRDDTPLVFYMSELSDELRREITEWFIRRQPKHMIRRLHNREADDYGNEYALVFDQKTDAMEFKLIFL